MLLHKLYDPVKISCKKRPGAGSSFILIFHKGSLCYLIFNYFKYYTL